MFPPDKVTLIVQIDAFGFQVSILKPRGFGGDQRVHVVDEDQLLVFMHAHQLVWISQFTL